MNLQSLWKWTTLKFSQMMNLNLVNPMNLIGMMNLNLVNPMDLIGMKKKSAVNAGDAEEGDAELSLLLNPRLSLLLNPRFSLSLLLNPSLSLLLKESHLHWWCRTKNVMTIPGNINWEISDL